MQRIFSRLFVAWTYLLLVLTGGGVLHADPRVRVEVYDARKVYEVFTAIGIASLIQFEEGESLVLSPSSVLGIGDADAWNLGVRGNNIVLKPVVRMPRTNIVVATNRRTYTFDLLPASANNPPTYIIRFIYPDTIAAQRDRDWRSFRMTEAARAERRVINTNYIWKGDISEVALVPTAAWDDGRFTRFAYDHAGELPIFYKVLPDGTESLLNYNVDPKEKATIILHEVIRRVRVRFNEQVIEIHNRGYRLPSLNRTGSSEHGAVRVESGGGQ
jgi:type IV secretion system protein VirB9